MALVVLIVIAALIATSRWVWLDAERRGMNPRWAIGVGLALIFVLPIYLAVRKPIQCANCGKEIVPTLTLCEECEASIPANPDAGRAGRLLG